MKKQARKNNLFLFIAIFTISLLMIITFIVRKVSNETSQGMRYLIELYVIESDDEIVNDILKNTDINQDIYLEQNVFCPTFQLSGVYYGKNIEAPTLKEGRFFYPDEYQSDKNIVIISEYLGENTYEKQGGKYITILGEEFEVIGVLLNDNPEVNDFRALLPLRKSINNFGIANIYRVETESASIKNNLMQIIKEQSNIKSNYVRDVENSFLENFTYILEKGNNVVYLYLSILISLTIFLKEHIRYWIWCSGKRIAVYHLCGASKYSIFKTCFGRFASVVASSLLVAMVIYIFACEVSGVNLINLVCLGVLLAVIFIYLAIIYGVQMFAYVNRAGVFYDESVEK